MKRMPVGPLWTGFSAPCPCLHAAISCAYYRHCTCGHSSCSCNGWNDLASNKLSLQLVHLWDLVITGAHVCQASNELHVEISVVILLKHHRGQLEATRQLMLSILYYPHLVKKTLLGNQTCMSQPLPQLLSCIVAVGSMHETCNLIISLLDWHRTLDVNVQIGGDCTNRRSQAPQVARSTPQ